jgi:ATP-dependent RNA helicase RhlB
MPHDWIFPDYRLIFSYIIANQQRSSIKENASLFRNLVSKFKSLFLREDRHPGEKPENISLSPSTVVEHPKGVQSSRKMPARERSDSKGARPTRKKETREEYNTRHAKRGQPKISAPPEALTEVWDSSVFTVPPVEGKKRFQDFNLPPEVLHAIYDLKFQYCTPVQAETLSKALAGDDVTAQAQTGTGKTAAFLITIFSHFLKHPIEGKRPLGTPRALILAPTRELVMQIDKDAHDLGVYVPCRTLPLFGGIDYLKQQKQLQQGPCDVLVCTPGRLIDFKKKKLVDLSKVEILILDEADRMLDMGFIPAVKSIVLSTPPKAERQTMFFSATISSDVKRLAESWTRQAFQVTVKPEEIAVESVEQITYITTRDEKPTLLFNLIMQKKLERVLIFANRRDEARRLKDQLEAYGISCALLSGDVDQKQRINRLERFREGNIRVLVATDVASRGIHVEAISHVINYNLPLDVEEYVHRIGRTGRAGASGISINFADEEDSHELPKLEEFLGKKIECVFPEEDLLIPIPEKYPKHGPVHRERKVSSRPRYTQRRRR